MADEHVTARRVALGTAANMGGQAIVVLSVLVVTPVVVRTVGATDYGVWVLFGSVASLGMLLELGIAAALVKFVAEHAARGDVQEASLMVGAAHWLYVLSGGLLIIIGLAMALVVPAVLELHHAFARLFAPLAILVGLNIGLSMVAVAPVAVLRGLQRYPTANAILGGGALMRAILIAAALVLGGGIISVAAASVAATILTYIASVVITRRSAPGFMPLAVRPDWARARRLIRFSRSVAMVQVAIGLQSKLDTVVIGVALPVRLVAPYNFGLTLANGIGAVTDQFAKVVLPMAAERGVSNEPGALRRLFLASTRLTMAITFAVGIPVAVLGGPILGLWVGKEFSGYGGVVALLALAAIVDLPAYPAAAVLQGIERHGPIAWMALGSGVVNLALSIALVGPYGIEGVAAATLAASAVEISLLVVPYAARVLGVSLRKFCSDVVLPLAPPVALLTGTLAAGKTILPVTSFPRLVVVAGIPVIMYALVYATFGASSTERDAYRSAAAAVVRLPATLRARRTPTKNSSP
jgi:O-antigen/teichoic acid export membrane protein